MKPEELWQASGLQGEYEAWAFGEAPDQLAELVIRGVKTATCSAALLYEPPVYYASANGTLVSFLDRLFYSTPFDKRMKVGAAVACARRGGLTATFDELSKYFTIAGMPVASSQYWNGVHGAASGEAEQDGEGLQIMRTLARNMSFLMKSIALGKERYGLPPLETRIATNFVR